MEDILYPRDDQDSSESWKPRVSREEFLATLPPYLHFIASIPGRHASKTDVHAWASRWRLDCAHLIPITTTTTYKSWFHREKVSTKRTPGWFRESMTRFDLSGAQLWDMRNDELFRVIWLMEMDQQVTSLMLADIIAAKTMAKKLGLDKGWGDQHKNQHVKAREKVNSLKREKKEVLREQRNIPDENPRFAESYLEDKNETFPKLDPDSGPSEAAKFGSGSDPNAEFNTEAKLDLTQNAKANNLRGGVMRRSNINSPQQLKNLRMTCSGAWKAFKHCFLIIALWVFLISKSFLINDLLLGLTFWGLFLGVLGGLWTYDVCRRDFSNGAYFVHGELNNLCVFNIGVDSWKRFLPSEEVEKALLERDLGVPSGDGLWIGERDMGLGE